MKKYLFLVIMAWLMSIVANAQERAITRGAVEGELYLSTVWYLNYYEVQYNAILHITENGKKVEINYNVIVQSPDAGTGDALPMQALFIMADATPGVVYNADWYMAYAEDGQPYGYDRLWISDDYGKTWEVKDRPVYQSCYYISNFAGLIYRGGGGVHKSTDYGATFSKMEGASYKNHSELGWKEEEVFAVGTTEPYKGILTHTLDFNNTYTLIPIDSQFMFGQIAGVFPDVFRGGLSGEVYITSRFPENMYKLSFSADTGYHFRVLRQQQGYIHFMSDRKAGDFYIVTQEAIETQQPWGWYNRMCVEYYTDYGETLVGIYCHDLTREGVVTAIGEMEKGEEIAVCPNPTDGELRIRNYELGIENVEIFDLLGRTVETWRAASLLQNGTIEINISYLPAGMYFLRIQTETGVVTRKVVKQ